MRLSENVEMLEIMNDRGTLYPILLWDDVNTILIDTGLPGQLELIRAAVEKAGVSLDRITKVILTHHDMDHIGSAKLIREFGAEIWTHESEAPYIQGDERSPKLVKMEESYHEMSDGERVFLEQIKEGAPMFHVHVDRKLRDGETLPYCGGIKIIHTPGHTPGHISLHLMASDILVAGDAANITDGVLTGANPVHTLDMEKARESFEKIKEMGAHTIACYHGGCIKGTI